MLCSLDSASDASVMATAWLNGPKPVMSTLKTLRNLKAVENFMKAFSGRRSGKVAVAPSDAAAKCGAARVAGAAAAASE